MYLQLNHISKQFGTQVLFEDLSLQILKTSRIGLIGRNGTGKSTLLKIIMGDVEPESGNVSRIAGLKVNYLSQEPRITPHWTVYQELRAVFSEINQLQEEELEIIEKLEAMADASSDEALSLAHRLDVVHQTLDRLDARSVEARISRVLKGLGFSQEDAERPTGEFSGGWQMRINLAKLLLEGADILLLDEPTNHLDLDACEWLESYLSEYPGGLVLVSHDQRFLDAVPTEIAELENKTLTLWPGNYSKQQQDKAKAREHLQSAYDRQQKEIAKQSAFVERFRASATRSTQAKSREKQLEKIERIELTPEDRRKVSIRFPTPKPSGRQIVTLKQVAKSFGEKHLFKGVEASLERDQRIFLLGENGSGKTTLLRMILGLEPLDQGEVRIGHHVSMGYFSQKQLETLDPQKTPFETLQDTCPQLDNTAVRTVLGRFLLGADDVFKPVGVLSGGEKSKVALAKLMMTAPNVMLLDEPTNHMDIPAKQALTDALSEYEGSFLCISHDRHFINALATHVWELYKGQLLVYHGGYDYYLSKRDELRLLASEKLQMQQPRMPEKNKSLPEEFKPSQSHVSGGGAGKNRKVLEKEFKQVERDMMALESELVSLTEKLQDPATQQDFQTLQTLTQSIQEKQGRLDTLNEHWQELAEELS